MFCGRFCFQHGAIHTETTEGVFAHVSRKGVGGYPRDGRKPCPREPGWKFNFDVVKVVGSKPLPQSRGRGRAFLEMSNTRVFLSLKVTGGRIRGLSWKISVFAELVIVSEGGRGNLLDTVTVFFNRVSRIVFRFPPVFTNHAIMPLPNSPSSPRPFPSSPSLPSPPPSPCPLLLPSAPARHSM